MNHELESTFAATIADKINAFDASGVSTANAIIGHVNHAREIGLLLTEWSQGQFTLSFHEKHSKQLNISFDKLRSFVKIASRLPAPATTMDEARHVIQLDFQTAGLLAIPESTQPTASSVTPYMVFVNRVGQMRETIAKLGDIQDVAAVKQQLKPIVEFYESLK